MRNNRLKDHSAWQFVTLFVTFLRRRMVIYYLGKPEFVDKIVVCFFLVHHLAYGFEQGRWYESSICTKRGTCGY